MIQLRVRDTYIVVMGTPELTNHQLADKGEEDWGSMKPWKEEMKTVGIDLKVEKDDKFYNKAWPIEIWND
jgi:hypothetical protein